MLQETGQPPHWLGREAAPRNGLTGVGHNCQDISVSVGPRLDDLCPTEQGVSFVIFAGIGGTGFFRAFRQRGLQDRRALPWEKTRQLGGERQEKLESSQVT